jgi:ABC-type multidrug transport system ATPase subunit
MILLQGAVAVVIRIGFKKDNVVSSLNGKMDRRLGVIVSLRHQDPIYFVF